MRLAIITNILTPYRVPLFSSLNKRVDEFRVFLMASEEGTRQWRVAQADFGYEILSGVHVRSKAQRPPLHINYGTSVRLRRFRPDIVVSGGFTLANLEALLYCRVARSRYVVWGEVSASYRGANAYVRDVLRRYIVRRASGYIASSSETADVFVSYGAAREKVLVSLLAIDVERFRSGADEARKGGAAGLRRGFGWSRPVLLSVSRLLPGKGYREMLAVYEKVLAESPSASLVIVGDGPERERLEAVAHARGWSNVFFVGYVQSEELPQYLAAADVFVFPTLDDRFGAVLPEAMAAGVPVVSSVYAAATRDLITDGVTGFAMDPRDVAGSAAVVGRALRMTEEQRKRMRSAAQEKVAQCGVESSAEAMVAYLESLMRGHRGLRES